MPKAKHRSPTLICIACADTGINSKGRPCIPCAKRKALQELTDGSGRKHTVRISKPLTKEVEQEAPKELLFEEE